MNPYLVGAAALFVVLGVVHSVLGERALFRRWKPPGGLPRIMGSEAFSYATIRVTWHVPSVLAVALAVVVYSLSDIEPLSSEHVLILRAISIATLVSGVLVAAMTKGKHLAWVAFFLLAALCWLGA